MAYEMRSWKCQVSRCITYEQLASLNKKNIKPPHLKYYESIQNDLESHFDCENMTSEDSFTSTLCD